jgi:hypothetical protein
MKILDKVQEVFNQYELKPIKIPEGYNRLYTYLREHPEERYDKYSSEKNDEYFLKKYGAYIPKGWYGFSIGTPIVPVWCEIIDKILEICVLADYHFEINQIKLKFGGIRFYVNSQVIKDIDEVESLIEKTLHDNALIY